MQSEFWAQIAVSSSRRMYFSHNLKFIRELSFFSLFKTGNLKNKHQLFGHFKLIFSGWKFSKRKKKLSDRIFRFLQRFQKTCRLHGLQFFRAKSEREWEYCTVRGSQVQMHTTALKESRKLRAAEGKGAVGFIGIKKVIGLENFVLTTIYCVFNHRGFGGSRICLEKAKLKK